jgi:lysophospholipase L1-like esterase
MKNKNINKIKNNLLEKKRFWIVFTGDSITSCEWVHPNWRDIAIYALQDTITEQLDGDWKTVEWGLRGFNFAYDGATTTDIVDRLDDILLLKPDLVIGLMGGNDPLFNIDVEESVLNIRNITNRAIHSGADIVWSNSTPSLKGATKNQEYLPYAQAFMDMPDQERFTKIDMFNLYSKFETEKFFTFISESNPDEGLREGDLDPHHPNQLGNAYIAKIILAEVFEIEFNPEKYIADTLAGVKFPSF